MIELIVQHDDTPSVYHPDSDPTHPRRYGFHHWARFSRDFDAEVARLQAAAGPRPTTTSCRRARG